MADLTYSQFVDVAKDKPIRLEVELGGGNTHSIFPPLDYALSIFRDLPARWPKGTRGNLKKLDAMVLEKAIAAWNKRKGAPND